MDKDTAIKFLLEIIEDMKVCGNCIHDDCIACYDQEQRQEYHHSKCDKWESEYEYPQKYLKKIKELKEQDSEWKECTCPNNEADKNCPRHKNKLFLEKDLKDG